MSVDLPESWKTGPWWEIWEYIIPKGSLLYHITAVETKFQTPKGITWFTEKKHIAEAFMRFDPLGFLEGPNSRILTYKTLRPIIVVELGGRFFDLPSTPGVDGFGGGFYNEAKEICKTYDYDGWILPCVYDEFGNQAYDPQPIPDPDPGFGLWPLEGAYEDDLAPYDQCGADIMICNPTASMIRRIY